MPSFNFKPTFIEPICAGTKLQTIRKTRRCGPGAVMHLYTGLRTKQCVKLAQHPCIVSDYVHLAPDGLTVGNIMKHPRDTDEFAQLDGFRTYDEMHAWFVQQYGSDHFYGFVHRWEIANAE